MYWWRWGGEERGGGWGGERGGEGERGGFEGGEKGRGVQQKMLQDTENLHNGEKFGGLFVYF